MGNTYRSRPSEVEAVQWTGDNLDLVREFGCDVEDTSAGLMVLAGKNGAQGYVLLPVGHWVVRRCGDLSDHWPVAPDYFAEKYQLADG